MKTFIRQAKTETKLSVIIPAYNPEKKIISCLITLGKNLNFLSNHTNLEYEVLIINNGGENINLSFDHKIKNIKQFRLRKNMGVGYARQLGTRISRHNYIMYLDSDIVLENDDTIKILLEEFIRLPKSGSVGPVQTYKNLSNEFTSDFVSAKTCYGFEDVEQQVEFSGIRSECCIMEREFLNLIGGWKFFPAAGSEEFELGHRIIKYGKKNYITKKTDYTTYYKNLYLRCRTVAFRTSTYLPVFINRKKFETKGAFATFSQVLSTFFTLLTIAFLLLSFFVSGLKIIILLIIFINFLIEFDFLKFALKHYKKRNLLLYLFGIYAINFSIITGVVIGILRFFSSKKFKLYLNKLHD